MPAHAQLADAGDPGRGTGAGPDGNGPDVSDLADALRRLCPGFAVTGSPVRTGTSLLLPGSIGGMAVLAKQPTDLRPFWQDRCRHEIAGRSEFARAGAVITQSRRIQRQLHVAIAPDSAPGSVYFRAQMRAQTDAVRQGIGIGWWQIFN